MDLKLKTIESLELDLSLYDGIIKRKEQELSEIKEEREEIRKEIEKKKLEKYCNIVEMHKYKANEYRYENGVFKDLVRTNFVIVARSVSISNYKNGIRELERIELPYSDKSQLAELIDKLYQKYRFEFICNKKGKEVPLTKKIKETYKIVIG